MTFRKLPCVLDNDVVDLNSPLRVVMVNRNVCRRYKKVDNSGTEQVNCNHVMVQDQAKNRTVNQRIDTHRIMKRGSYGGSFRGIK